MAKYCKDVQDSPRTGLDIPVITKKNLFRTNTPPAEPPFGFKGVTQDEELTNRRISNFAERLNIIKQLSVRNFKL